MFAWRAIRAAWFLAPTMALFSGCALHAPSCRGSQRPTSHPSTICPFGLRGVRVASDDVDGGVDVTLTTFDGDVATLRTRAHEALDGPHDQPVPARHQIVDVDAGIVIRVRAIDPAQVEALRAVVQKRIDDAGNPDRCGG